MLSWNYRIVRKTSPDGASVYFEIHEVYYREGGTSIEAWSENPIAPSGESVEELKSSFELMAQAFQRPVLTIEELENISRRCDRNKQSPGD